MLRPLPYILGLLMTAAVAAPPPPDAVRIERVFPRLSFQNPLFLAMAPGDRAHVYVVTQRGKIFVFDNVADPASATVFLEVGRLRGGYEEGLLGLAFHPQFAQNRLFYIYYTPGKGPRRTVIERYRAASATAADRASGQVLLEIEQPYDNHNGGMLAFGPDGMLYAGPGDGGSGGDPQDNAQNLGNLLGKILRLTPDGGVPPDNPFVNKPGARGEIWAYGLRNPWRFSFDRRTGELWAADVGQDKAEEIDVIVKGGNYGWRLFEGRLPFKNPRQRPASDFVAPVHTYGRDQGGSVTGGYVYRGRKVPALEGAYVYGDFASGRIWALARKKDGGLAWNREIGRVPNPSSFGEGADGELYITAFDGGIYEILPGASP